MNRTIGNALLASVLSIILSVIGGGLVFFYPLIKAMLASRGGAGIGAGGGAGGFMAVIVLIPLLFLIIFNLLQSRSKKWK
jgi:hypothetical protein